MSWSARSRTFWASEIDPKAAKRRAVNNERFWRLVFCCDGLSYSDLSRMDLYEFAEAEQARLLWQDVWNKRKTE